MDGKSSWSLSCGGKGEGGTYAGVGAPVGSCLLKCRTCWTAPFCAGQRANCLGHAYVFCAHNGGSHCPSFRFTHNRRMHPPFLALCRPVDSQLRTPTFCLRSRGSSSCAKGPTPRKAKHSSSATSTHARFVPLPTNSSHPAGSRRGPSFACRVPPLFRCLILCTRVAP